MKTFIHLYLYTFIPILLFGQGATVPFTTYEAENASTNGSILAYSTTYKNIASEASGRKAVSLQSTGNYVEFTLTQPANCFVLRFCIPDLGTSTLNLGFSINGNAQSDIVLTSQYAWVYGDYPYNDNSSNGNGHRFFDEKRVKLGQTYPAGTKFRFTKNANCTASYYTIDLIEAEVAAAAVPQPSNSISLASYTTPNDGTGDNTGFNNALNAAISQGKILYIPEGEWNFAGTSQININNAVSIQGAGMWYTTLSGNGVRFNVKTSNVSFKDFHVSGAATYRIDDGGQTAIESDFYTNISNLTIQNLWVEHTKCAFWIHKCNNAQIKNNRVRTVFADGIHLRKGCTNSVIEQNHVRNTVVDGIAQWSADAANENNLVRYNTVELPSLANGIAVYGGANIEISNNIVRDIVKNGAGINVGTDHNPISCNGYMQIKNNKLERCGSYSDIHAPEIGAIWLCVINGIGASITIEENEIVNSVLHGILVQGNQAPPSILVKKNTINGCVNCVHIGAECNGSMTLQCNTFSNYASSVYDAASGFSVNINDSDCSETEPPEDNNVWVRLKAPVSWTKCYAYVWGSSELAGGWTGAVLSKDAEGFYVYSADLTGITTANLIFNNGNDKIIDIDMIANPNTCWQAGNISGQDEYGNQLYSRTLTDCGTTNIVDISDFNISDFNIYPNPATDFVVIEMELFPQRKEQEARYEIYDVDGKLVKLSVFSCWFSTHKINIVDLKSGTYFLKINNQIAKFIKK